MSCCSLLDARGPRARWPLALLATWVLLDVSPALSQTPDSTAPASPAATIAEEITVTATRTPRSVDETPGTVSVTGGEEIDRQLMTSLSDLVRFEPGVYVDNDLNRLGLGGFNIRGIGGNRVLTRIDGVPAGERFELGPLAVPQYALDLDALATVEIVRSAGSALYGSDALGGVVTLVTKDPADYLGGPGGGSHFEVKAGYAGRNREIYETGVAAVGGGRWQASLFAGRTDGEEMDNQGDLDTPDARRTAPNPQDTAATNALGKLVFYATERSSWKLGAEVFKAETETEVFTSRARTSAGPTVTDVSDFDAVDERERTRVSLEHNLESGSVLFDRVLWRVYGQENDTGQRTLESVASTASLPGAPPRTSASSRHGLLTFEQSGLGGEAELQKALPVRRGSHLLTYGVSYSRDVFDQIRDRKDFDPVTGAPLPNRSPLVYPTKYFPESEVEELGVYVQDEIDLAGGRLRLVPGLRYDRYNLDPDERDPIYLSGNAGIETPAGASSSAVSPRLGVVAAVNGAVSLFGQYARGFRAPAFDAVNSGFTNVASGYTTLPNPDLEPETSDNVEAGVRGSWRRGRAGLTLFRNRFDDFIEQVTVGVNPATGLLEFQPQNIGEATVSGVELNGEAQLSEAWLVRAAAAYLEGDNDTTGQPLNSIAPPSAVLGLRYTRGRWGAEATGTFTAAKDEDDVDRTVVAQFAPPSSEVFDLTFFMEPADWAAVTLGVFNLFDETWWSWPDVIGRAQTSPVIDRYTRPGRSFAASLRLRR